MYGRQMTKFPALGCGKNTWSSFAAFDLTVLFFVPGYCDHSDCRRWSRKRQGVVENFGSDVLCINLPITAPLRYRLTQRGLRACLVHGCSTFVSMKYQRLYACGRRI